MRNIKGQALVEFVLVLPILIMLIFAVIDFGSIYTNKSELESLLTIAVNEFMESGNYNTTYTAVNANIDNRVNLNLSYGDNNYVTIKVSRELDLITPGFNLIFASPYNVSAERVIRYENE